jgi:hypothetical protein
MKTKELILEASTNEDFKNQLLTNPKLILKEKCNIDFKDDVELKVVFEDKKTKYLVIPFFEGETANENMLVERGKGPCSTTNPGTNSTRC